MRKRIIGLSTVDITQKEIDYVTNVLKSNKISPGEMQFKFESALAKKNNYKYATFCNSGQSALHLCFETIKLLYPKVKYVVCPATTYISTLYAVLNANLNIVLEDVNLETFNMDSTDEYDDSYCICPVNLMGLSANLNGFYNNINNLIVEDNAESLTSPCTGYGDFMCTSFYASHQITTGSGGMVFTNNEDYDEIVKSLCNHGRIHGKDIYSSHRNETFDKSKKFIFNKVGFSFKSSDINAALGLAQVERIDEIIQNNIKVAKKIIDKLKKYNFIKLPPIENNTFMNLVIMSPHKMELVKHLNEYLIETRDMMPILNQPIMDKLNLKTKSYPNSERIINEGFYIGCHKDITDNDIDYIDYVFGEYK